MHYKLKKTLEYNITKIYSRIPVTRTLKGSEKQFELTGNACHPSQVIRVRVIEVLL